MTNLQTRRAFSIRWWNLILQEATFLSRQHLLKAAQQSQECQADEDAECREERNDLNVAQVVHHRMKTQNGRLPSLEHYEQHDA